jgi:N-formylglutamate amidohydrolase
MPRAYRKNESARRSHCLPRSLLGRCSQSHCNRDHDSQENPSRGATIVLLPFSRAPVNVNTSQRQRTQQRVRAAFTVTLQSGSRFTGETEYGSHDSFTPLLPCSCERERVSATANPATNSRGVHSHTAWDHDSQEKPSRGAKIVLLPFSRAPVNVNAFQRQRTQQRIGAAFTVTRHGITIHRRNRVGEQR